VALQKDIKIR